MAIQAQLYSENLGFALGGHQDLFMDNANCGFNNFCFIPHQQQLPKQTQQQQPPSPLMEFDQFQNLSHQKNYNSFLVDNNRIPLLQKTNMNNDHHQSTASYSSLLEKHRTEIDRFLTLQNERLRMALQEQRKQQMAQLMKKYESKTQFLLKQKEDEILKAETRRVELENLLKKMEMENQTWQRVAKENEAMVASLNGTIERLKDLSVGNAAEDAESCCCLEQEEEMKRTEGDWAQGSMKMVCRSCNSRQSFVIMLPCRHMCSCRDCEPFLDSCPVCRMVKKASIEALF